MHFDFNYSFFFFSLTLAFKFINCLLKLNFKLIPIFTPLKCYHTMLDLKFLLSILNHQCYFQLLFVWFLIQSPMFGVHHINSSRKQCFPYLVPKHTHICFFLLYLNKLNWQIPIFYCSLLTFSLLGLTNYYLEFVHILVIHLLVWSLIRCFYLYFCFFLLPFKAGFSISIISWRTSIPLSQIIIVSTILFLAFFFERTERGPKETSCCTTSE